MLAVFVLVMLEPAYLCGCASGQNDIVLELSDESAVGEDNSAQNSTQPETQPYTEDTGNMTGASGNDIEPRMAYIYVCGAVALPGVYSLRQGSRLYEAVELAGGLTQDADETCLNMAREITDGEQVVILTQEETALLKASGTYFTENSGQEVSEKASGLVNINTADAAELTSVSGIGESRAQAIIEYREKNGMFHSIEDIKKVDGIKEGLFSKIKDKIKI